MLPHFGTYNKKREEILHSIRLKSDLLQDNKVESYLSAPSAVNDLPVVKIRDVVGAALPSIGPYKQLDNTKQVVALVDDVSEHLKIFILYLLLVYELHFRLFLTLYLFRGFDHNWPSHPH